jgi:retinoid hydroxylase
MRESHPRSYQEIPILEFPPGREWGPGLAQFIADTSLALGPVFRRPVRFENNRTAELLYMVGPDANRMVFHTQRERFSHDQGWTPVIGETLGNGLLNMDPPEHTRHRLLMNPAFTSAYMAAYLPVMERVIADRTRDWAERDDINLLEESREIAFDIAAAALVSARTGPQVDRLRELFYLLLHGFDGHEETWDAFLQRRNAAQAELVGVLLTMIAARRAGTDNAKPSDVLGMIVNARDEAGNVLSDEQILAHVNILLVAGHETTTMLGGWVLYLIATHPDYLARVTAELDAALGPADDATLTVEAIRATPLLGNAIKEAGRLESPVQTLPRGVILPFEFGGYAIPAGTQVRLAIAATHRLPPVFPNPDRFDPDRFAPPRDEERRTPYALATFGGGTRICIGINFAQIEVKALAASVLRRYRLEPLSPRRPEQLSGITSWVPEGIDVRAVAR